MTSFESFGNPRQFEIAARWRPDSEPRSRLPLTDGWSTGELRITVCDQILTEHRFGGDISDCLSWYLSPVIDWFIRNWASLLHEESFAWPERSTDTAAVATVRAIKRYMASPDEAERGVYEQVHYWRARHALRAADSSAIFPDIYFRRVADDIEISWLARQPDFAPENFSLTLGLGSVQLPVSAVATALWEFLNWATSTAPAEIANDKNVVQDLRTRFEQLSSIPVAELERCYVGSRLQEQIDTARRSVGLANDEILFGNLPVIESLDSAALMFGGLNVDLAQGDIQCLLRFMFDQKGQGESSALTSLVRSPQPEFWCKPWEEGYALALECREDLAIEPNLVQVDIDAVLRELGINVREQALTTQSIRGVAVAGQGLHPGILINTNSFYNNNEQGRRFTLAHEFCHILYDRTRAKKLSHLSGPWTSVRTEQRANAFAAMFLAPPSAIRNQLSGDHPEALRQLADEVGMGVTALVKHLNNIGLIDDAQREQLEHHFGKPEQFDQYRH